MIDNALRRDSDGNVLIAVLFMVILLGGFVVTMHRTSLSTHTATTRNEIETRLLYVAESGVNVQAVALSADPLSAVKDTTNFTVDSTAKVYVGAPMQIGTSDAAQPTFRVSVQYLNGALPVVFADRSNPKDSWDTIKVTSSAAINAYRRTVSAWYKLKLGAAFSSAVISDSLPTGGSGSSKSDAGEGHIVIYDQASTHVFGGMRSNGSVAGPNGLLTDENAATELDSFSGSIKQNLAATAEQIPDFTALGGNDQLFDFDRFRAAAAAGAGQVFTTLADFATACNAANAVGNVLEGITVLEIDSGAEGSNPKIGQTAGDFLIPDGINIRGTLMFRFSDGTSGNYKIFIKTPLRINAADLTGFNPSDQSTYTSAYPPTYTDTNKTPWNVDISPTYENFVEAADLPALMFNNGIVDIHDEANICGVVYGPSFIEIENKEGLVQYFNGAIIGGGGVYVENKVAGGVTAIRFDEAAVSELDTFNNRGKSLSRTGFVILK